ncbi:hypothetical protein B0I37DRAFT_436465 [Chaetomium sp. MPI-CAGE-AT-0009]|nr:hypothetical protein B0I37DRAFT_436465 [Chaetomium sp. MPI-CAGE-AT-0009]
MTIDQKREELLKAHRLIRAKYDAGVPFITKDLLRDVVRELENNSNETVAVTGLDGRAVHFPIETGKEYRYHPYEPGNLCIRTKPLLRYKSIQWLLADDLDLFSVQHAYLPVELAHATVVRNIQTSEVVSFAPACDYATASREFEQAKQSLEGSAQFAQFKSTLASVAIPPGITKIVALACSTMTWPDDGRCFASMAQHILALTIRDILTSGYAMGAPGESRPEIKCYAQDPIYTPIDEQVLGEAGFTLVDDPRGFIEVDEASVLISFYPDIPIKQIVADIARPALIIWNKADLTTASADPESPRVHQMMGEYIELPFPAHVDWEPFGNLAIYARKGG